MLNSRRLRTTAVTAGDGASTSIGVRGTTNRRAHTTSAIACLPGGFTGEDPERERRRGSEIVDRLRTGRTFAHALYEQRREDVPLMRYGHGRHRREGVARPTSRADRCARRVEDVSLMGKGMAGLGVNALRPTSRAAWKTVPLMRPASA
jgi:hypothetical protein